MTPGGGWNSPPRDFGNGLHTNLKSTELAASESVALLTPVSVTLSPWISVMTAFPALLFVVSASSAIRSALWLADVSPDPKAEALN